MLPKSKTKSEKICRTFKKLGQISVYHPLTFQYFRSYSTMVAERQHILLDEGDRIIHPLSLFSLFWTSLMTLVNLCHTAISPFRLFFVLEPLNSLTLQHYDKGLLFFHLLCIIDVVMKFNIGYIDKKFHSFVLDRKSIAWRYVSTWFIVDLVSSLPLAFILLYMDIKQPRLILVAHLMPLFRIARIYTVTLSLNTITQLFTESYVIRGGVRITILSMMSVHWGSCLIYMPPVILYYWTGAIPPLYNHDLHNMNGSNLLSHSIDFRYSKASIIVVSAFFDTSFTMFRSNLAAELIIHFIIIFYATMFEVYTIVCIYFIHLQLPDFLLICFKPKVAWKKLLLAIRPPIVLYNHVNLILNNLNNFTKLFVFILTVFFINSYLTIYNSTKRYIGLMNQVEEYMKYRQFPVALKKRVRTFYEYVYQKHYFKEQKLKYLSEQLRDEIRLHTSRVLIYKVKLFENIPASTVGTVLGCLQPEVYLANDLVMAAGDMGGCMYFIATGTVAVYSLKGVEICHLEDGAHFGEVALFMKDRKRVVTVVAVETTQLYRLDLEDFRRYIMKHPVLYERIEKLASCRMHETVLIDDAFRYEREQYMSRPNT